MFDSSADSVPTRKRISVVIAGSTERTRVCASAIFADERFEITGVITPTPKPIGRKKIVEPNPVHTFAVAHEKPLVIIETKIDDELKERTLRVIAKPDILLVVDFGYIVPKWMLEWPSIGPVNVHPSDLPSFRGSSPGQFVLSFGEKQSAVTIMRMDEKLDHGPIITKVPFLVQDTWTQQEYYDTAFSLTHDKLAQVLADFCTNSSEVTNQPDESPTPTARMLHRDDGFVPYETLMQLLGKTSEISTPQPIPFLESYQLPQTPEGLFNLWRGFSPWPGLWTLVKVRGEEKRMKLLELTYSNGTLTIEKIQVEGKLPQPFDHYTYEE